MSMIQFRFTGKIKFKIERAENLRIPDVSGNRLKYINPYCTVNIDDEVVGRTNHVNKTLNPIWNTEFEASAHRAQYIEIVISHRDVIGGGNFISSVRVAVSEVIEGNQGQVDLWVCLPCLRHKQLVMFFEKLCISLAFIHSKDYLRFILVPHL